MGTSLENGANNTKSVVDETLAARQAAIVARAPFHREVLDTMIADGYGDYLLDSTEDISTLPKPEATEQQIAVAEGAGSLLLERSVA